MAITITQERKKQRYVALALAAIIFAILAVVWLGFSKKKESIFPSSAIPAAVYAVPNIGIDWQILENLRGRTFGPFEKIAPLEKEFGRKNPFVSY